MLDQNEIRVINARELDKSQAVTFIKDNVRDFYTLPLLEWQYLKGKSNVGGLFFLLLNDKIISSQGMIPINLCIDKKKVLTAKSESSFLSPDYRGRGYFEKLYLDSIEKSKAGGAKIFWGFTLLAKVWKDKLGFKVENVLYESRLQVSFTQSLKSLYSSNFSLKEKSRRLARYSFDFYSNIFRRLSYNRSFDCRILDLSDNREREVFHSIFEKWNLHYDDFITLQMSDDYIKWRIAENESVCYTTICLSQNGENVGVVTLNHNDCNLYLVEFIVPDSRNIKSALKMVTLYAKKELNAAYISYIGNIKNRYNILVFDEFRKSGANIYNLNNMNFVLRVEHENFDTPNSLEEIERYYINGLWTEGFRI